uniref:Uncharacterized protein n=1 Tax=Panagrolaimus davidi TaxID=227884 RepID=A0A914P031_9BILA
MKSLFAVGIFLCLTTFVVGHIWHPGQNSPPQPEEPHRVIEEETFFRQRPHIRHPFGRFGPYLLESPQKAQERKLQKIAEEVSDWLLQKPKHLFEPENQLPQSSNNYHFNIVQNFFLDKPVNQIPPKNPVFGQCHSNKDCKKRFHHCSYKGFCELKLHIPDCYVDRDCERKLSKHYQIFLLPVYCNKGHCVIGHRKPVSPIPTLPATVKPQPQPTLPPLPSTTKKPKHCKIDYDCNYHGLSKVYFKPKYCKRGVCVLGKRPNPTTKKPKQCKTYLDCKVDTGILKILVYGYCDNGICKPGSRPTIATVPTTPTTQVETTKSHQKFCRKDLDCVPYGRHPSFFPHFYCDHGICKQGILPAIATQNPHSKHCKEDFECNPLQKMYLPLTLRQYCDHGICKHGVRPAVATSMPIEPTTTELIPTTESAAPQTCKKDQDCIKQIGFQHKTLVSVYCNKGYCALKPQENDAITTESTETSTAVQYLPPTCNVDEDCSLPFNPSILNPSFPVNHRPVYCDIGKCKFGSRELKVKVTTDQKEILSDVSQASTAEIETITRSSSENYSIDETSPTKDFDPHMKPHSPPKKVESEIPDRNKLPHP